MTKTFVTASFIVIAMVTDASARCSVPLIRTVNNQTVDGRMMVSSGDRCAIRFRRSSGPTFNASIVQRPSHGSVVVELPHRIVYRSRAGYVGEDAFTYARHGLDINNNKVVRTVRVRVNVTAR